MTFNNCQIISHNRSSLYSGIYLQQFIPVLFLLSRIKFLIEKIILDMLSVFFNSIRCKTRCVASLLCNISYLTSVTAYTCHIWLYFIIMKRIGDVEENSGPQYNSFQSFSIVQGNLNSLCTHNFIKFSFPKLTLRLNKVAFNVSLKLFWIVVFYLMMLI